jgi:hypothetical protein
LPSPQWRYETDIDGRQADMDYAESRIEALEQEGDPEDWGDYSDDYADDYLADPETGNEDGMDAPEQDEAVDDSVEDDDSEDDTEDDEDQPEGNADNSSAGNKPDSGGQSGGQGASGDWNTAAANSGGSSDTPIGSQRNYQAGYDYVTKTLLDPSKAIDQKSFDDRMASDPDYARGVQDAIKDTVQNPVFNQGVNDFNAWIQNGTPLPQDNSDPYYDLGVKYAFSQLPQDAQDRIKDQIQNAEAYQAWQQSVEGAAQDTLNDVLSLAQILGGLGGLGDVKFPSANEMARRLETTTDGFHRDIKPEIMKDASDAMKKIGNPKAPEIGEDNQGNIWLRNNQTGRAVPTGLPLSNYGRRG